MKRLTALLSALIFFAAIAFFSIGSLVGAQSGEGVAANLPMRQPLLRMQERLALRCGKTNIGSVYVTDARMFRMQSGYDADAVARSVTFVNHFAANAHAPVYWMVAPTAAGIYAETLPSYAPQASEQVLLNTAADSVTENVNWIDVYGWLYAMRDAYIYYRTDPHWTTYGAFCAYKTAIRKLGFANLGYDRFVVEHATTNFRGAFAQETQYDAIASDAVDLYHCETGATLTRLQALRPEGAVTLPALYDRDRAKEADAYRVFVAATEPILQMETSVHNTKSLLVLTDSYGACLVPFLMQHYRDMTVVNLALVGTQDWQAQVGDAFSQILILCSGDTLADADGLAALAN